MSTLSDREFVRKKKEQYEEFKRKNAAPRVCLGCERSFASAHPTNRICSRCVDAQRNYAVRRKKSS